MTELPTAITSPAAADPAAAALGYEYDVLILDGGCRQSLVSTRSLGRAGLRLAVGETSDDVDRTHPALAFGSRYCAATIVLPSFVPDVSAFVAAVLEFAREHPTRVILPASDRVIGALLPVRAEFAALGCTVALPPTAALDIANDKDRTIEVARGLGIECPRSVRIDSLDELPGLLTEFSFPFVLKPTSSWAPLATGRLKTVEVIDEVELSTVAREFLSAGVGIVAQEWVGGRREAIGLFIADDEVRASFACLMLRTCPTIGGISAMRVSIPMPQDIYAQARALVGAVGLQGACEVEFRRDGAGRPHLMEINARLAGPTETAQRCGVDFPLLIWQWATGGPVGRVHDYRAGVRMRWLRGDLRWLRNNFREAGRPDSVTRPRAVWLFLAEFLSSRHYDCLDWRDIRPSIAEIRSTLASAAGLWRRAATSSDLSRDHLHGPDCRRYQAGWGHGCR
jgi:predicted ATP-grasp superfamily ATP-dependent carboligase